MPKNQGHKDKLYISATEWAQEYGGKKRDKSTVKRALPFDSCALSLQPYETPICTAEGIIFDVLHIMPFLQKHKCNPCNSKPMKFKDLVRLNMTKNADGKWHCPVTFKVFNDNSKVVAIKTTGYVYAYEAVEQLNIKAKNWKVRPSKGDNSWDEACHFLWPFFLCMFTASGSLGRPASALCSRSPHLIRICVGNLFFDATKPRHQDLMTDEPFKREDIITLLDPADADLNARRDISNFSYLKDLRDEATAAAAATPAASNIRATPQTAALFKEIEQVHCCCVR